MKINKINFLTLPYIEGYEHAKLAFKSHTSIAKDRLCTWKIDAKPTLSGRLRHLGLAILLLTPLLNTIVHLAITLLFEKKSPPNPAVSSQKPSGKPSTTEVQDQLAITLGEKSSPNPAISLQKLSGEPSMTEVQDQQIESFLPLYYNFIERLHTLVEEGENLETSPIYSQFIHDLVAVTPQPLENHKKKIYILAPLIKMLNFNDHGLNINTIAYATYRLKNEFTLLTLQDEVSKKNEWDVLEVPGDGNCFLWSCVFSERIKAYADSSTFSALSTLKTQRDLPLYKELAEEVNTLRGKMATTFIDTIHSPKNQDFQRQFASYITYNEEVYNVVLSNESEAVKSDFCERGIVTESIIERYVDFINNNGNWNGEFEAELVSKVLQRPIFMLSGHSTNRMQLGTVAGIIYLEQSEVNPIFVRHSGAHYDCLVEKLSRSL